MPLIKRPETGWSQLAVWKSNRDYVGPARCERCGRRLLYVRVLEHPRWRDRMHVGCQCAKRLARR